MFDTVRDLFLAEGLVAVLHFHVFSSHLDHKKRLIRDQEPFFSLDNAPES